MSSQAQRLKSLKNGFVCSRFFFVFLRIYGTGTPNGFPHPPFDPLYLDSRNLAGSPTLEGLPFFSLSAHATPVFPVNPNGGARNQRPV